MAVSVAHSLDMQHEMHTDIVPCVELSPLVSNVMSCSHLALILASYS